LGGDCQQGCQGKAQSQADPVAAIAHEKGNGRETRHSDWTTPYLDCNGRDARELRLLAVAAACGHPLAPFEVGEKRGGQEENAAGDKDDLHDEFRIARKGSPEFNK
jgi:hypothetical protein